jgi:hypothetical protein
MILYRPTDGDPHTKSLKYRPKTCFIMSQMGANIPSIVTEIRKSLSKSLKSYGIQEIDAETIVTGRDFLLKVWGCIITVPMGIAIVSNEIPPQTMANIFYEIGLLQAYGKETLVIKTKGVNIPSDLVRTEYLEYDANFQEKINKFLDALFELPEYFETMSEQLENDPLLSIDYLRRAFLITGNNEYREKAKVLYNSSSIKRRAKNSVEMLLLNF